MEQTYHPDSEVWSFPLFNEAEATALEVSHLENDTEKVLEHHDVMPSPLPESSPDVLALEQALQQKIAVVEALQQRIQQQLQQIDNELIQQLSTCIKKVAKKVIQIHIQQDPILLQNMLKEMTALLPTQETCKISVSKEDYIHLQDMPFEPFSVIWQVDETLHSGDFKITTPTSTIIAILEDRLSACFGC